MAAALLLVGSACSDTLANEDGSLVERLRIVAVQANPPEVAPGGHSYLTPLVMDPKGAGRALTYTWLACDPALDFYGTVCSDGAHLAKLESLADDPSVHRLGSDTRATYFAPSDLFFGRADDDPVRYFGVPAEVVLVVSAGSFDDAARGTVESQVALVDVAVSDVPSNLANENPSIASASGFTTNTSPMLSVVPSCDSAQSFEAVDPTSAQGFRDRTETLTATWFTPEGSFAAVDEPDQPNDACRRSTPNVLDGNVAFDPRVTTDVAVVLRDDRGGVDFRLMHFGP